MFPQFNCLLRDIFGLGAPLILDAAVKANKISRFEKVTAPWSQGWRRVRGWVGSSSLDGP